MLCFWLSACVVRDRTRPLAALAVHEKDVQDAQQPLPDATGLCAVRERGSRDAAVLANRIAVAAREDQAQDALYSGHVSLA